MLDVTYSAGADALYVRLRADEPRAYRKLQTEELDEFRNVDRDARGRVMGVEFLEVSAVGVNLDGVPEADRILPVLERLLTIEIRDAGSWLASARKRLGLTQEELAEELGVRGNTVARWERGDSPIANPQLIRLAVEAIQMRRAG